MNAFLLGLAVLAVGCTPPDAAESGSTTDTSSGDSGSAADTANSDDTGDSGDDSGACAAVDPRSIDFGEVSVGSADLQRVTVTNCGAGTLNISALSLGTGGAFSVGNLGSINLPSGLSTIFDVTFEPPIATDWTDTVSLLTDDADDPLITIPVSGTGVGPTLAMSPSSYDFGRTYVGCEAVAVATLSNLGNDDLIVSDISFITASSDLTLDEDYSSNGPLPWTVIPGGSREVFVTYAPLDDYADEGYLVVESNDPVDPSEQAVFTGVGEIYGQNLDVFEQGAGAATEFELTERPVEATLVVAVDGAVMTSWTYSSVDNAVVFDTAPAEGAIIEIEYVLPGC